MPAPHTHLKAVTPSTFGEVGFSCELGDHSNDDECDSQLDSPPLLKCIYLLSMSQASKSATSKLIGHNYDHDFVMKAPMSGCDN